MSDDMEIMKELKEKIRCRLKYVRCSSELYSDVEEWLPDAVKRDRVRVLRRLSATKQGAGYTYHNVSGADIMMAVAKYSPSTKYCEGMQEAIDRGEVTIDCGQYFIMTRTDTIAGQLKYCHRCPNGENCIEVQK